MTIVACNRRGGITFAMEERVSILGNVAEVV